MRSLRRIFITLLILFVAYWLISKVVVPSFRNIFKSKPVTIDETPILIKEIKSIGQLVTYSSIDEVVVDTVAKTRGSAFVNRFNRLVPVLPSADKKLVLIGRGKVLAGTNLSLLTDTSVSIEKDTVRFYMPKAVILDAILNPSDFETFIERGQWSNEEVTLVKAKARREIIQHALQQDILQKAETKAKAIMENFLRNLGYKEVLIF